jgi:hypothetical protein
LEAAPSQFAGIASAVNNDVAEFGGLLAVAMIPSLAGLTAASFSDPIAFSHGFRHAMLICAALAGFGGILAFLTIQNKKTEVPPRRLCGLLAPPLQPQTRYRLNAPEAASIAAKKSA